MVSMVQLIEWSEESAQGAYDWHRTSKRHSESELEAFKAGHLQGYMAAIRELKRHGYKFKT